MESRAWRLAGGGACGGDDASPPESAQLRVSHWRQSASVVVRVGELGLVHGGVLSCVWRGLLAWRAPWSLPYLGARTTGVRRRDDRSGLSRVWPHQSFEAVHVAHVARRGPGGGWPQASW